jgi:replicative DNA helicase
VIDQPGHIRLDKVPPQAIDAERSVLGSILVSEGDRSILGMAMTLLGDGEPFYREAHKSIWKAFLDLDERGGIPITLLAVTEELERVAMLEKVGGVSYIDEMMDATPLGPTVATIEYEARIVLERYTRRQLIYMTAEAYNTAFDNTEEAEATMSQLEKRILDVRNQNPVEGLRPARAGIKPVFQRLQDLFHGGEDISGVPSGFVKLDRQTAGFQAGEYVMVAARPSMGKSIFVMDITRYNAIKMKMPVVFFSLEMSEANLLERTLAAEGNIEAYKMRTGRFEEVDWPKLTISAGVIAEAPIYIDASKPNMTPLEVRARCHKLRHTVDFGLIVIDYIQLMGCDEKITRRNDQLTQISGALKAIAREFNVPLIAVSQLSRGPEGRENKRPLLSDLRESGSLEQDADVVIFLYRGKYYDRSQRDDIAEIILAKQRNGPVGTIKLLFDPQRVKFKPLAEQPWLIEREAGEEG